MSDQPHYLGEDVIAHAGQHLTDEETTHLAMLADGATPSQIERDTGADRRQQQHLESAIRAKLGARTKPHMIARGFVLDVLAPRALCLMLALLSVGATPDGQTNRIPRRAGTPATASRSNRSQRHDAGPNGPLPDVALYAQVS